MALTADELFDLDPDDPRTPSQQIANAIRAAILLDRLVGGDRLPSHHDLSRRYGVARETVKSALRILDREQLVVSRQGSGVFVRSRRGPSRDIRQFLRTAFDRPHVSIDYAGFRAETLSNTLPDALDVVRTGRAGCTTLAVRLLLVEPAATVLPRPVDEAAPTRAVRSGLAKLLHRSVDRITDAVGELTSAGMVRSGSVEVRLHRLGPTFKAFLLNGEQALFGFYPVGRHLMDAGGRSVELHHPSGWETTLHEGPFVDQTLAWFESVWSTVAVGFER